MNFTFPEESEYPEYFKPYLNNVKEADDILELIDAQASKIYSLIESLSHEQLNSSYAPSKWTIKEVLTHIIDTERIFSYRALCIARGEVSSLPGFDHDNYIAQAYVLDKPKQQLLNEYSSNRKATIDLFKGFSSSVHEKIGVANGLNISVRSILFILAGHELHHFGVISEKYLNQ